MIPEAYIPVKIQADDASLPQASTPSPTTTLSALSDDGVTETGAADEYVISETTQVNAAAQDEFPTPLPFLDEPEEKSVNELSPSNPSRETLTPPNFDLNKVTGISGVKTGTLTPTFVGRQSCSKVEKYNTLIENLSGFLNYT